MKIRVLFHHPEDDPSLMPNAVLCMDEYLLETAGEEVWDDEVETMIGGLGPGSTRVVELKVSDNEILRAFQTPTIDATLQGA